MINQVERRQDSNLYLMCNSFLALESKASLVGNVPSSCSSGAAYKWQDTKANMLKPAIANDSAPHAACKQLKNQVCNKKYTSYQYI